MRRPLLAGVIGLAVALLGAPAALASTVTVASGNTVRATGAGSERNVFGVAYSQATDTYTVTDATQTLTATGTCTEVNSHTSTCPGTGITRVEVNAGNGDDLLTLDRATVPVNDEGDLDGGSGIDLINGHRGPGDINAGNGNDIINGWEGADDIAGGSNTDLLLYTDRTTPLQITVGSGNGNDGNELDFTIAVRDTVRGDVENIFGGSAGDILVGDGSSEVFDGMAGDDNMTGNSGNDTLLGNLGGDLLFGTNGSDVLRGSDRDDFLFGGNGNDRLAAGLGNDFLRGDAGNDAMKGKLGADRIQAKDGERDIKINCGPQGFRAKFDKRLDPRPRFCGAKKRRKKR